MWSASCQTPATWKRSITLGPEDISPNNKVQNWRSCLLRHSWICCLLQVTTTGFKHNNGGWAPARPTSARRWLGRYWAAEWAPITSRGSKPGRPFASSHLFIFPWTMIKCTANVTLLEGYIEVCVCVCVITTKCLGAAGSLNAVQRCGTESQGPWSGFQHLPADFPFKKRKLMLVPQEVFRFGGGGRQMIYFRLNCGFIHRQ